MMALIVVIVLLGCDRRQSTTTPAPAQDHPLTLNLGTFTKSIAHAPLYAALHFKWFEEEPNLRGVKIQYRDFNDRATISDAFANGSLDVLFSAEIPQILCRAQGNDIRIVMLTTWAIQEILIQNDITANSFVDLRGKTLAVQAGTSSHYAVLKLLEANGMRPTDLNLKFMSPAEARTAFESREIDAWAVWAPWIEQQTVAGRDRKSVV